MNEQQFNQLLDDVKTIIVRNRAENYKQGKAFNVFWVEGIASDEVRVCRFIRELLDPRGSHGQGSVFLKSFIKNVFQLEENSFTDNEYAKAVVAREELIDESRRIDLVIKVKNRVFPIEVKVYAQDQDRQCFDYYKYAVNLDPEAKIFYLTLDGHEPSKESKCDLSEAQYVCLSFSDEILKWLDDCIRSEEILQVYSVKEVLIQFRTVIRDLTGIQKGKLGMEIKEKIEISSENMIAAVQIAGTLPLIKTEKIKNVFDSIKSHMEKLGYKECLDHYINESSMYYDGRKSSTYPSINYVIPVDSDLLNGKIVLRFEIDHRLFFGVAPWNGENNWNCEKNLEAKEYVDKKLIPSKVNVKKETSNWYWWKYLDEETPINYRCENEEYYKLYDPDFYQNYLDRVFSIIDSSVKDILG